MRTFISQNFTHALCILILISRLGDIISTYLLTPTLKLEANLLVRKLGWRFALLTMVLCIIPYYSTSLGVVVLVPSLLVSAANISKIWLIRTMGEDEYAELILFMAKKGRLKLAIYGVVFSSLFIALAGFILCYLSPDPNFYWGYWFGLGIILYGMTILVHGSIYYWRLFKKAKESENSQPQTEDNKKSTL